MATAMFAETLDNSQYSMQLMLESQSFTKYKCLQLLGTGISYMGWESFRHRDKLLLKIFSLIISVPLEHFKKPTSHACLQLKSPTRRSF
jgi:hypothetical protein